MINPLSIATDGYLCGGSYKPLVIAVNGYLCIKVTTPDIETPPVTKKQSGGYKSGVKRINLKDTAKERQYINKLIIKEEEEILTFIKVFLKCH